MSSRFGDELVEAIEHAERWALHDPDPVTRGQLDALVDAGDPQLIRLFERRLAFGTAGLRAEVGPGPDRMNALVVRQTTAAVVRRLRDTGIAEPLILIGYDGRKDSSAFAAHAAAAAIGSGGRSLRSDGPAPTPVIAHAVLAEQADAGIVITASHNPPADNGYKLYLGDGLQLVTPADTEISAIIDDLATAWHEHGPTIDDAYADLDGSDLGPVSDWISAHRSQAVAALFTDNRNVTIAYTAMHGVGGQPLLDAFTQAGFPAPAVVLEQFEPDGSFPTVNFPNPEEPGAFDLALDKASAAGADAAFANDPDADRLAIAVPSRDGSRYEPLSGNQLGALLADHVLRHTQDLGDRVVARSIVSSRLLDAMAESAGVRCEVTLTGFKWVARPILSHAPAAYVFGFEEAIGYCVGSHVRDKDGVTAALVAAEMLATLKAGGSTVWDRLDELARTHGLYLNQPISIRFDDEPARVGQLMDRVAQSPPGELGGAAVEQSGPVGLGHLPPTVGLHLVTANDTQVIIRPSGTEPKIKAYIEVHEPVAADTTLERATAQAEARLEAVAIEVQALLV